MKVSRRLLRTVYYISYTMYFIHYNLDNPSRRNRMGLNHPTVPATQPTIDRGQFGTSQRWNQCCSHTTGLGCSHKTLTVQTFSWKFLLFFIISNPSFSIRRSLPEKQLDCERLPLKMNNIINRCNTIVVLPLIFYMPTRTFS